jgi:N-acetylneuraminic acid mutarotase
VRSRITAVCLLAVASLAAIAQPFGWYEMANMPLAPSGKPVKRGCWLTFSPGSGLVFAQKGFETNDFYSYYPQADTWHPLGGMPYYTHPLWAGKVPHGGSRGVSDGNDIIYVTQGNNTLGFWSYHISQDSWAVLQDVPWGPDSHKIVGGRGLALADVPGGIGVYLLKDEYGEFYSYDPSHDNWSTLPRPPGATGELWGAACLVVFDGVRLLYVYNDETEQMWRFDVRADTWLDNPLKGMPGGSAGGPGAWYNGCIYALRSGNTDDFWKYDVAQDTWLFVDTIPSYGSTGKRKHVSYGADLVSLDNGWFYATKGNKTVEFWRYGPPDGVTEEQPTAHSRQPTATVAQGALTLLGRQQAELLDIAGRKVMDLQPGENDIRHIAPGVYFVRSAESGERSAVFVRKVVIQR